MSRFEGAVLALTAAVLMAWQVPLAYRKAAGLDEDLCAVPAATVLETGVPRIPYLPSRDRQTIYFHADELLLALPPLSFYLAAPLQAIAGPSLGAARVASLLEGFVAVAAVWALGRLWTGSRRTALAAALFYAGSRPFLFPATTARPDMAATACGLLALLAAAAWRQRGTRRLVPLAGACAGLAVLAHPVGVVPAAHAGLVLLTAPGPARQRLRTAVLYSVTALAVFALWTPLIALRPELLRAQFGTNVLGRAGPGLLRTVQQPVPVLAFQFREIHEHLGSLQLALFASGLAFCLAGTCAGDRRSRTLFVHAATATLLLFLFMGRHGIRGYYAYPAAVASLCVGMLLAGVSRIPERAFPRCPGWWRPLGAALVAAVLALGLAPGAGLRLIYAHLKHWHDPHYDARALVRQVLAAVPPDAPVAAESLYVFECYRSGRPTVEALIHPFFFDVRTTRFRYVVLGPDGLKRTKPRLPGLVLRGRFGDPADPFAYYAELYEVAGDAAEVGPQPRGVPPRPLPPES